MIVVSIPLRGKGKGKNLRAYIEIAPTFEFPSPYGERVKERLLLMCPVIKRIVSIPLRGKGKGKFRYYFLCIYRD